MKIYQSTELSDDPVNPMELVNKRYVDEKIIAGSVNGGVFFTNIAPTSTGIVGTKAYVPNTVPANKVITEGTSDTNNVRVSLVCEGGTAFYSPTITITTVPALTGTPAIVTLTEDGADKRLFAGFVDLMGVSEDVVVTATSSTGAVATTTIKRAAAGPAVSSATIGAYPGAQTEAKSGDVMPISGVVANTATYVEVVAGAASNAVAVMGTIGAVNSAGAGFRTFSGTFVVSGASGAQTVAVRGRNTLGTFGNNTNSTNSITLNQTYPTIGTRTIAYPATQTALKGSETATVSATITNADSVVYSSSADLSVTAPTTLATAKTVTRVGGAYVNGTNNYTITATKASNAAVSVATAAVVIADAAATATIAITGAPSRLRSSEFGNAYIVNVTPTQALASAPTVVASSGTWQGSWSFSGGVWSRTLSIADADVKGAQTFNTLAMTGKANVIGSTITSGAAYTVGGFTRRILTVPAFQQKVAIGTNVVTIAKTSASYSGASVLTLQGSTAQAFQGYTITDAAGVYSAAGNYLFITDADFAGSNTSGTLLVEIEEAA